MSQAAEPAKRRANKASTPTRPAEAVVDVPNPEPPVVRLEIYAAQVQPKRPAKRRTRKPAPRVPKLAAPAGSVELEERHAAMAEREQSLAASWRRSASG